ncbi:MAG: aminoacyl-tRNA hydrolase [Candidatus Saccharimonas sp.]
MKVIVGLGNPETRYTNTRHNVGFAMVDKYALKHGAAWKHSDKFKAQIAEIPVDGEILLLVKPTTYYNLVGESVRALMDFYKLTPGDILIVHDDLALPLGTIRTRIGGSDAGNNGLKSVSAHCGDATARLRIGIWTEQHTTKQATTVVLGTLTKAEAALLQDCSPTVFAAIDGFVASNFAITTQKK